MDKTIAVEHDLTPVIELLTEKGYKVDRIDVGGEYTKNIDKYDALVISGMNKDFMGVQDIISGIPIVEAKGLTAEEVVNQLTTKLKQ